MDERKRKQRLRIRVREIIRNQMGPLCKSDYREHLYILESCDVAARKILRYLEVKR